MVELRGNTFVGRIFFGDPATGQVAWDCDCRPSDACWLALKVGRGRSCCFVVVLAPNPHAVACTRWCAASPAARFQTALSGTRPAPPQSQAPIFIHRTVWEDSAMLLRDIQRSAEEQQAAAQDSKARRRAVSRGMLCRLCCIAGWGYSGRQAVHTRFEGAGSAAHLHSQLQACARWCTCCASWPGQLLIWLLRLAAAAPCSASRRWSRRGGRWAPAGRWRLGR